MAKKMTIEEIKRKVKDINCNIEITNDFYDSKLPLSCVCLNCGHEWEDKYIYIIGKKLGCPSCQRAKKIKSTEDIKTFVEKEGYEFINDEVRFKKNGSRYHYITIRCLLHNHTYSIDWNGFKSGCRCRFCGIEKAGFSMRRKTTNDVVSDIEKFSFTILEDFEYRSGSKTKLKLLCQNGHRWDCTCDSFYKLKHCPTCHNGYPHTYDFEYIKNYFLSHGCELLSDKCSSSKERIIYRCSCGEIDDAIFYEYKKGNHQCKKCNNVKRRTLEEVSKIFKDGGCELLSENYVNTKEKLLYKCSCGRISEIDLYNFINGSRCYECYRERNVGENHPNWNHNKTEEERLDDRKYQEYSEWRISVFEKDKYTCLCCEDSKGGNLTAHHKDGYNWCVDRRTDVLNGVTLCDSCHKDFHSIYGYGDNTESQYNEWILSKSSKEVEVNA